MHSHEPEPVDVDQLREMGYEERDVNVGALGRWCIYLFAFIGISIVVSYAFFKAVIPEEKLKPPMWERTMMDQIKPDAPLLQREPTRDITTFLKDEDKKLNGSGLVDEKAGKAHIPIKQAMETTLDSGALPVREGVSP